MWLAMTGSPLSTTDLPYRTSKASSRRRCGKSYSQSNGSSDRWYFIGGIRLFQGVRNIHNYIRSHLRTYIPGGPHVLDKDDEYNGYLIPAGTIVLPNQWCVQMFSLFVVLAGGNMHQGNATRRNGISRAFRILARALGSRRRAERAARPREGCVWLRAAVRADIMY